jgi:hypothetical protein
MSVIKKVLAVGEKGVLEYIENNIISDSDLQEIMKYQQQIESKKIKDLINKMKNHGVSKFIANPDNFKNQPNYVLKGGIDSLSEEKKLEIIDEIILRFENKQMKLSEVLSVIKRNETINVLKKLNEELLSAYVWKLNFNNLQIKENFNKFFKLQTSGIFQKSLISLIQFEKALVHWGSNEKEIKKIFNYFDACSVMIAEKYSVDVIGVVGYKELLASYIDYHIEGKTGLGLNSMDILSMVEKYDMNDYVKKINDNMKKFLDLTGVGKPVCSGKHKF